MSPFSLFLPSIDPHAFSVPDFPPSFQLHRVNAHALSHLFSVEAAQSPNQCSLYSFKCGEFVFHASFLKHLTEPEIGVACRGAIRKRKTERETPLLWKARNIIEVQFANTALGKVLVLSLLLLFSCLCGSKEWRDTF